MRRTARSLSAVENRREGADELVRQAYRSARCVPVIGITGPPGAGKSTLVDRLAVRWAEQGEKVAVLAVDPTSPFTGGAVLGDRFRMELASSHPRVYVRSLASRGHLGGLSETVIDMVMVLGELGFDRVILETVGAGQTDVTVGTVADAVIVASVPGLGDQIQAAKAGILEIGDLYLVNKSDLPGAAGVAGHLEANLDLIYPGTPGRNAPRASHAPSQGNAVLHRRHGDPAQGGGTWRPPVLQVCAREGSGIEELARATDDFLAWSRETGRERERRAERLKSHILRSAQARLIEACLAAAGERRLDLDALVDQVAGGAASPEEAASRLIDNLLRNNR